MKFRFFSVFAMFVLLFSVSCSSGKKNEKDEEFMDETVNDADILKDEFGFDLSSYDPKLQKFSVNVKSPRMSGSVSSVYSAEVFLTGGTIEGNPVFEIGRASCRERVY